MCSLESKPGETWASFLKMYTIKGITGGDFIFQTKEDLKVWLDGVKHALWAYGHWKESVLYVGTTGKTFKEAWAEMLLNYKLATGEDYE